MARVPRARVPPSRAPARTLQKHPPTLAPRTSQDSEPTVAEILNCLKTHQPCTPQLSLECCSKRPCCCAVASRSRRVELHRPLDAAAVSAACVDLGVWLRPFGRNLYTMPPYVAEPADIAKIAGAMRWIAEHLADAPEEASA